MNRLSWTPPLLAAALALGAASAAHARSDVSLSIGIHAPLGADHRAPVYVQPAPVYVQPRPVYVQPRPVYVQPAPVYVHPAPVYHGYQPHPPRHGHGGRRGPWGDADRDGVPNRYDRHPHLHDGHAVHGGGRRDADRDGIPNRYDRAPHNPYYR